MNFPSIDLSGFDASDLANLRVMRNTMSDRMRSHPDQSYYLCLDLFPWWKSDPSVDSSGKETMQKFSEAIESAMELPTEGLSTSFIGGAKHHIASNGVHSWAFLMHIIDGLDKAVENEWPFNTANSFRKRCREYHGTTNYNCVWPDAFNRYRITLLDRVIAELSAIEK